MKYLVIKGCAWRDFNLYEETRHNKPDNPPPPGVVQLAHMVDDADLKTKDGQPLPREVVEHFVAQGCLQPVAE